jgi:hypothetical protein
MDIFFVYLMICGSFFYFAFTSIRDILVGKGKINDPMYDTIEKKQKKKKKGIMGLIFNPLIAIILIAILLRFILYRTLQ